MKANTVNAWRGIESEQTLTRERLDWQTSAACVGAPLGWFFPESDTEEATTDQRARELCASCPVRVECLDYSLTQPERYGRWGGLNEIERAHERRRRLREANAKPKPKPKPKPKKVHVPRVDATGVRRRIRASSAVGRRLKTYSQLSGVSQSFLSKVRAGRIDMVREDIAKKIVDAYPAVLACVDDVDPIPMGAAAAGGWHAPGAWEGLDIDDSSVEPDLCAAA